MQAVDALSQRFSEQVRVRENEPLRLHTRFAIGGPARYLVDVKAAAILPEVVGVLRGTGLPLITLGGGSNLVVADAGFDGIVLRFTGAQIRREGDRTIAETGAVWQHVVDFHNELGLAGMEKMTGIPGWLGGAVYGNAGAYGQTIMDFVESVQVFDGASIREVSHEACGFAYRTSGFKAHKDWVLLAATMRLVPGDGVAIRASSAAILATRNEKFPPTMKCAGSIFKNLHYAALPDAVRDRVPQTIVKGGKVPSAWFLEQVGAKGLKSGGIEVAAYHANLIYNTGDGTAREVCELIDLLKQRVQTEFGFALEEEVQYIGFADRISH